MKSLRIHYLLGLHLLFFLTACTTFRSQPIARITDVYCEPAIRYEYDSTFLPKPDIEKILLADTSLTRRYSTHDLLLANATGILPLLQKLIGLEKSSQPEVQLESVRIHQQILNRLLLASTQIAGLAAELDCEGERADQVATYLNQRDTKRIRRLTILSVVIGAITTVATALIQSDDASKVIGIGGGVVSAGFGGLAALSSNRVVQFAHQRNLLTDIWNQSTQSSIYPPMVWYVLNEKQFSNSSQQSISHNIRQRWQDYVVNGASSEQLQMLFGPGGNYQADDLHSRANMLNQLQSSVRSINQDLQSLVLTLSR